MSFLFGVCAFSAVFIGTGTLFRIAQYITEYGASITSVIKIFVLSLPAIIVYTFPMSMLLAALLTIGRLSSGSEITAMKSCGISFYRIAAPALLLGALISVFSILFNEHVVPWANESYNNVLNYEIKGNTTPQSQEHIIIKQIDQGVIQRLVYARNYDSVSNTMQDVTMQSFEKGRIKQVENAEYAEWLGDHWKMYNGVIYDVENQDAKKIKHTMHFDSQLLPVNATPQQILREQKTPEELTMQELEEQIEIMQAQYVNTKKLETELYQRYTIPMASLVFTLIAVPLGMQSTRNSSSVGFAISIVIIFVYYAAMTFAAALGQGGLLPPAFAVWIPNLIGLAIGVYLIRRAAS